MSGDDHSPSRRRRHGQQLRPLQGAQPGRLRRRQLGLRALDLATSIPNSAAHQRAGRRLRRRRLRGRAAPARRLVPDDADLAEAELAARLRHAAGRVRRRSTRASRLRSRAAPTASTGPTGPRSQGRARPRDPDGRQLLPLPGRLDRREARLPERRRLPDALRRPRRLARSTSTRQNTNMTDESSQAYPATVDALLDNALGPLGYYGAFGTNIHNDNPAPQPAPRRSSPPRRPAACRSSPTSSCSTGPTAATARRSAASTGAPARSPSSPPSAPGANGLQTLLPTQGPTGTLSALTCGGSPRRLHGADDQGHPVRDVRHGHRHLSGDVLVALRRTQSGRTCADGQASLDFCVAWRGTRASDHVRRCVARSGRRGRACADVCRAGVIRLALRRRR